VYPHPTVGILFDTALIKNISPGHFSQTKHKTVVTPMNKILFIWKESELGYEADDQP
jgi:hypothetical protein